MHQVRDFEDMLQQDLKVLGAGLHPHQTGRPDRLELDEDSARGSFQETITHCPSTSLDHGILNSTLKKLPETVKLDVPSLRFIFTSKTGNFKEENKDEHESKHIRSS